MNTKNKLTINIKDCNACEMSIDGKSFQEYFRKEDEYTFAKHQELVQRTRNNNETELPNYALGLVCEAGEFGDMVKKYLYQGHALYLNKCKEELGDVLWYLANICNVLNIDLAEVAKGNVEKLKKRYPNGFGEEYSVNRVDVD